MGFTALTALDDALRGVDSLGFDTSPFIYLIERHSPGDAITRAIFRRVTAGEIAGITSPITMTELLTKPLQAQDTRLANRYRTLLLQSANFRMVPIHAAIADTAAMLRARYRLRTPDALQVATAIDRRCDAFLTNDHALQRVSEIPIIILDELTL